jgi:hypothetical protein
MYYFVGNSHLGQFKLNTCSIAKEINCIGASIKGLINPNSKLQLNKQIQYVLQTDKEAELVFCLGQVDIEFGYYYKCVIDNKKYNIHTYIQDLLSKYELYLTSLPCKVYVSCINPTVITNMEHIFKVCFTETNGVNGYYSDIISGLRYEDIKDIYLNDSFEERFRINKLFNQYLEIMCKRNSIPYIDYWSVVLNEAGDVKEFYKPKGIDHHLQPSYELRDYMLSSLSEV